MSATLQSGIDSLTLTVKAPLDVDGVTPRDDLIGLKVWYSTTDINFNPLNNQGTLAYDGAGLSVTLQGLSAATTYYVKYALISEIDPESFVVSDALQATPVYETKTIDVTPPPTPSGITLSTSTSNIIIQQDAPTYTVGRGHNRTFVYLMPEAPNTQYQFSAAILVAQFTGNTFYLPAEPATSYRVWLKWESVAGYISNVPYGGTGGMTVTTTQTAEKLISALEGELSASSLTQELRSRIDLIDDPTDGLVKRTGDLVTTYGSTVAAAQSAADALISAGQAAGSADTASEQATIATNAKNDASGSASDALIYKNAAAASATSAAGSASTATSQAGLATNAKDAASGSETRAGISETNAASSAVTAAGHATSAATSLTQLRATVSSIDLISNATLAVDATGWTSLTRTTTPFGNLPKLTAGVQTTRDNFFPDAATSYWYACSPGEQFEVSAWVSAQYASPRFAIGVQYEKLDGSTNTWTTVATATAPTNSKFINGYWTAPSDARRVRFWSQIDTFGTENPWHITDVGFRRMDKRTAGIDILAKTVAGPDGTTAQYTVKTTAAGHVAGFGLSNTSNTAGEATSEFTIIADKFAIAPVNTDNTANDGSPFFHRTSATTINGVEIPAGTYMKAAFIHDASIDNAKIKDLNADKITAGYINAARIEAASIKAEKIDSRGLSIKDAQGNVILAAGTALSNTYIDNWSGNYINLSWWKRDASIPWSPNSEYNRIISISPTSGSDLTETGPKGGNDLVWYCQEVNNDGQSGGGWNAGLAGLDPSKTYRFAVVIRSNGAGGGSAYWGTQNVCDLNTTNLNTNPYFAIMGRNSMGSDRWYLFVGYVYPYGSQGNTHDSAGIWDCKTGLKVVSGTNYCHASGGANNHRAYQYYAAQGSNQRFSRPMVHLVDGTEPSLREFFEPSATLNQSITITNGNITGIGAGNDTSVANSNITISNGALNGIGTGAGTAVANSNITVSNGQLNGIGTGSGTVVANSNISISNGAISGIGTGDGTAVANSNITVSNGALNGIGTGSGTVVANSNISISNGAISGIGTGDGTAVANSNITISNGTLNGIGTGAGTKVDNSFVNISNNRIPNSDQTQTICFVRGWTPNGSTFDIDLVYSSVYWDTNSYTLAGNTTRNIAVHQNNNNGSGSQGIAADYYPLGGHDMAHSIPVVPGQRYIFSCYIQGHRCGASVGLTFLAADGSNLGESNSGYEGLPWGGASRLEQYARRYVAVTAPANASVATMYVRKHNTYDGYSESYMWLAAPQFEAVNANVSTPSPYVPGPASNTRQLGYSGDLNATYGADWSSNVTGATAVNNAISNAADAASTANTKAQNALDNRLNRGGADTLVGPISLNAATAILVGDTTNGLYLGNTGIVGRKGGVTKFYVSQNGDAAFSGDISGATGTFSGTVAAGSIDVSRLSGQTQSFTSNGSLTIANDYPEVKLTIKGAGGGGGGGGPAYSTVWYIGPPVGTITQYYNGTTGGSGGNGGSYIVTITGVAIGTVFNVYVGGGGSGGAGSATAGVAGSNGGSGGNSSVVVGGTTYTAYGGGGGVGGQISTTYGQAPPGAGNGSAGAGGGSGTTGGGSLGGAGGNYGPTAGTSGGNGTVVLEAYNPNGVVRRDEWNTLVQHLQSRFSSYSWP